MVWIAQTAAALGMNDEAEKVAKQYHKNLEDDETFSPRRRARRSPASQPLISILRQKGKFDEGPRPGRGGRSARRPRNAGTADGAVLDPPDLGREERRQVPRRRYTPGRASAASSKSSASELEKAGIQGGKASGETRKRPRELYDVTYNEALCLHNWAKKTGDKKNAKDGLQLLKQMLILDPKLNGPDTVTRFIKLANELELLLGMELTTKPGPAAPAKKADAPKPSDRKASRPRRPPPSDASSGAVPTPAGHGKLCPIHVLLLAARCLASA